MTVFAPSLGALWKQLEGYGIDPRPVFEEEGIDPEVIAELGAMGHPVNAISGHSRALFGRGQIIRRVHQTGVLWGGSDPRADGCAMSL